ncbi:flagellar filament capping protein FliD [Terrilactibacillus laevilacticus]|uniref:Flagellar hook-associated protein 2 n=1 Tax=Terrilactibacillus laevilacticus TaxID=1380157 RepID=A0ABW5PML0_9BACI|nr:flagellar filament capping protein FliD [Terrilactibacillus laevilacticus]
MVDSSSISGGMFTSSTMRIGGLASGMDIDGMVNKIMTAQSIPLDKMKQKLQYLEWQRDDYRSMNTLLNDLKTTNFNMKLQGTFLTKKTASTDDSKVTATASSSAGNTTYTLKNVKLATSAYNKSDGSIVSDNTFDPTKSIWSQQGKLANTTGLWSTGTVNNESMSVSSDGISFNLAHGGITSINSTIDVNTSGVNQSYTVFTDESSFNNSTDANKVLVNQETGQLTFNQTIKKGSNITVPNYNYNYINFNITTYDDNGNQINPDPDSPFNFDANTSLNTILSKISSSNVGVNAFYDSTTKQVSITRTSTGDMNPISGTDTDGTEIKFNGSSFLTQTLMLNETNENGGVDASFNVNGLQSTRHSNTFTLGNVTFNLKETIPDTNSDAVTITVNNDTDAVYDQIKSFVDKYNDTIKKINDKIGETKYRDYPPLTDAQKDQMKDSEITAWTDKAKSGTLSNDSLLSGVLNQMRIDLYSSVSSVSDSDHNQLATIGITTSPNYLDNGKLELDETKLKQALAENPDAVMQLFTNTGTEDDYASQGIAKRLDTSINDVFKQIQQKAGSVGSTNASFLMGQSFDDLNEQISAMTDRLTDIENRYYKQFSAMEQAIQNANQQSMSLTNLLGQ